MGIKLVHRQDSQRGVSSPPEKLKGRNRKSGWEKTNKKKAQPLGVSGQVEKKGKILKIRKNSTSVQGESRN